MRTIAIETAKNLGMGLVFLVVIATCLVWGPPLIIYQIGKDIREERLR